MSRRFGLDAPPAGWTGSWGLDAGKGLNINIPGVVDIHGTPVGEPAKAGLAKFLDDAVTWVKANPIPAAVLGMGVVILARKRR